MRRLRAVAVWLTLAASGAAPGRAADAPPPRGQEIYNDACASCHGLDGRGAPEGTSITVPLPDFTNCNFATREGDGNWRALVAHGGTDLGLSLQMPAFAAALTPEEQQAALDYLRSFCRDSRWPRGDLNFRRAIFTTKAFPEDEVVLNEEFQKGPSGEHDSLTELSVEHRVGARGEVELGLPLAVHAESGGATTGGIGDLTLAGKYVLYADRPSLSIFSVGLDLVLPSGDRDRGLGDGTVSFEPALLAGKGFSNLVLQGQVRGIAPIDENRAPRGVRYDLALSYPLSDLGRAWVPTVELQELQDVTASQNHLFITPEIYKGLSRRGHLAMAIGAQFPVAGTGDPFDYRVVGFFLWDYADGGLWW